MAYLQLVVVLTLSAGKSVHCSIFCRSSSLSCCRYACMNGALSFLPLSYLSLAELAEPPTFMIAVGLESCGKGQVNCHCFYC